MIDKGFGDELDLEPKLLLHPPGDISITARGHLWHEKPHLLENLTPIGRVGRLRVGKVGAGESASLPQNAGSI